jgi:hypothetical protein
MRDIFFNTKSVDEFLFKYDKVFSLSSFIKRMAFYLGIEEQDELGKNLELMTEWEYKYYKIKNSNTISDRRKHSILKEIEVELTPVLNSIIESLKDVYEKWLGSHAILSPRTWAEKRMEELENADTPIEEIYEFTVAEYERYGGNNEKEDFINANIDTIRQIVAQLVDEQNNGIEEDSEDYLSIDLSDDNEISDFIDGVFDDTKQFISSIYHGNLSYLAEEMIINFNEKCVFPLWYGEWSYRGIDETRENIEKIYKTLLSANTEPFSEKFVIITVALNSSHQTGSMVDYVEDMDPSANQRFLDYLSGMDVSYWDKELSEWGVG